MAPSSKLTAFLALAAASPYRDAFAFSPSPQHSRSSVRLSARGLDEDVAAVTDGWRKVSGGAAAFLTGMGIMTQVALADPSAIAPIDQGGFLKPLLAATLHFLYLDARHANTFTGYHCHWLPYSCPGSVLDDVIQRCPIHRGPIFWRWKIFRDDGFLDA